MRHIYSKSFHTLRNSRVWSEQAVYLSLWMWWEGSTWRHDSLFRLSWTFCDISVVGIYFPQKSFTDNDALPLKGFYGTSIYSLMTSVQMTLRIKKCYFIVKNHIILRGITTLLCWLHLILFMPSANAAQCLQSFLLHGFCLCQYLFVFAEIHNKKKPFCLNLCFNLQAFAPAELSAVEHS